MLKTRDLLLLFITFSFIKTSTVLKTQNKKLIKV